MQRSCKAIVLIGLMVGALFGQSGPTTGLTTDQLAFFDHFFRTVGDPTQTTITLQLRERDAALLFGFNQSETAALHSLAQQYLAAASQFNQSVLAIAGGKTEISNSDRVNLDNLNVKRQQIVAQLANSLLQQISPATAARFLNVIAKGRP